MPFVTDEVVTAAKLNMATSITADPDTGDRTFTNTGYLDLDALTGGAGSLGAVIVTVTTGTTALVCISGTLNNSGGTTHLGYRVSGATTIAAADNESIRTSATTNSTLAMMRPVTLTAGVNVFELQGKVTAATGRIFLPSLVVHTMI